jgi:hypothetical protein
VKAEFACDYIHMDKNEITLIRKGILRQFKKGIRQGFSLTMEADAFTIKT